MTATITIEVDADAARAFSAASLEERRKLELLLGLRLKELTSSPPRSLRTVMNEMGTEAEKKGLTPEILDSLLNDE
jgi:hypothetical protein